LDALLDGNNNNIFFSLCLCSLVEAAMALLLVEDLIVTACSVQREEGKEEHLNWLEVSFSWERFM
jgi:2-keto-4-pentenoate hydratase